VNVSKIAKDRLIQSSVLWADRIVNLDTNDFTSRETCFGPPKNICVNQIPVAHEFGHTMGNIGAIHGGASDEYSDGSSGGKKKRSQYLEDVYSMMHRGNQLRERHFEHLLTELHDLIPDTAFSVGRLQ
jgi:hypothetical protein